MFGVLAEGQAQVEQNNLEAAAGHNRGESIGS